MGGRDQSQVKIKFKKFEKSKSVPKDVPKSHNDDRVTEWKRAPAMKIITSPGLYLIIFSSLMCDEAIDLL